MEASLTVYDFTLMVCGGVIALAIALFIFMVVKGIAEYNKNPD